MFKGHQQRRQTQAYLDFPVRKHKPTLLADFVELNSEEDEEFE
jgi:hypothetical protein